MNLDSEIVAGIKRDLINGVPVKTLAEIHDVNPETIRRISRGETWRHVRPKGVGRDVAAAMGFVPSAQQRELDALGQRLLAEATERSEATTQAGGPKCPRINCTNAGRPPHTCPFKADINNDSKTLCECCDQHRQYCCDDI